MTDKLATGTFWKQFNMMAFVRQNRKFKRCNRVRLVEEIIQLRTSKLAGGEGLCNGRNTADWIKPKMQATRLIERSTISDDKKKEVLSSYTVYQCSYIRVMIIGNVL